MNEYKALISIPAENEDDFREQLDALDSYDLEWWCEIKTENFIDCQNCGKADCPNCKID